MNEFPTATTATLDARRLQDLAVLSDEAFWEYARDLAHSFERVVHPEEYLECRLGEGSCFLALNALYAVVLPPHAIAVLPATPPWMPGIVAWRGEVIAVIDLEAYLSAQPIGSVQEGTLLVAHSAGLPVGLLVAGVGRILGRGAEVEHASSGEAEQDESFAPYALPLPANIAHEHSASPLSPPLPLDIAYEQWDESLIVDVPSMLADVLRQIGAVTMYG